MSTTAEVTSEILRRQAEASLAEGNVEKAERALAEALTKAPNDHRALALMAELRLRNDRIGDAFDLYMRAVCASPGVHLYKERFLELAGRGLSVVHTEHLETAVAACLKTPDLAGAVENWASLLMASPDFQAAYGLANRQPFDGANNSASFNLTDIRPLFRPLFLEGMKSSVVCDPVFEAFVTHVRRHVLDAFSAGDGRFLKEEYVVLASALSHYAFFTDFILEETESEKHRISELRRRIEAERESAGNAAAIAMFACYRPLYGLANSDEILETFKNTEILSDVVNAQIADHVSLRRMAASIPALNRVADETSLSVREQYERFPYPRWKTFSTRVVVQNWQTEEFSQRLEGPLSNSPARILIAGCGTGRDAAIHSLRFPRSSITAVDVSRASLAYAALKARERGLVNLTFLHGDILDLGMMGQTFDYICCTGVLHHMEDPVAGWRVLCGLLRPGGLMRIGLYSRAGRKAVAVAQDTAKRGHYPPTRDGILRFRRECPSRCDRETMLSLSRLQDYYLMDMYRDLLFPAREHRFDLAQIKDMLGRLGLSFEGFYVAPEVLTTYRSMFRGDPNATNLEGWRQFESRYPETFASMYIFWCRKAQSAPVLPYR